MPPFIVACILEANRFAVARDAIGASWFLEQDGHAVVVSVPAPQPALSTVPMSERHPVLNRAKTYPPNPSIFYDGGTQDPADPNGPPLARQLSLLEVAIGFDHLSAPADGEEASDRTLRLGIDVAREAAATFIDWVRAKHSHSWADVRAPTLAGDAILIDVGRGTVLAQDNLDALHRVILLQSETWVTNDSAEEIAASIVRGDVPPLAEALIAEASHRLWAPATVIEATRAVHLLFAACEVKAEQTIRPSRKQRKRGVMAVFDTVAQQTKGRSLKQEDATLYGDLDDLKKDRNTIAHEGRAQGLTVQRAREHRDTAVQVIAWLESL